MQQAGVCCRPAGAGRSSGGTRTGRRHRFSSRFEAISRALQPGSKHAQPGVRTSTCTCTYNRWVWGGIKKKICRIRPLLLCGCVVHLLNYHWAGYEENLIVEKKTAPPHHVELAVAPAGPWHLSHQTGNKWARRNGQCAAIEIRAVVPAGPWPFRATDSQVI